MTVWITRSLTAWFRHRFPLNEVLETALQTQAFSTPSQVYDYLAANRNYDTKGGGWTEASATVSICASTGNWWQVNVFIILLPHQVQHSKPAYLDFRPRISTDKSYVAWENSEPLCTRAVRVFNISSFLARSVPQSQDLGQVTSAYQLLVLSSVKVE